MVLFIVTFFATINAGTRSDWEHQHLSYNEKSKALKDKDTKNEKEFSSHLPVVAIHTRGQSVPGEKHEKRFITTELKIFDQDSKRNRLTDSPKLSVLAEIKYRGNSSLYFDKKSLTVKFVDEYGNDDEREIMGMPSHSSWVLNGPFLDKTLMRNYLCMNVSAEIMGYAPRVRYCELFVDQEYRGLYLMMESIDIGKDRVDITPYEDRSIMSSYILRADRGVEPINEINNFSKYAMKMPVTTELNKFAIDIEYPPKSALTVPLKKNIEQDFSKFEKSLYSFDYDDKTYGSRAFIDTGSFVDYFIINEFFQNYDAGTYSTYFYKDIRDKINMGPVWDFNNACDNYMETAFDGTGFSMQEYTWFLMLMKDDSFTDAVIKRYRSLRKTYLKEEYLINYIDEVQLFLDDAIDRNFEVWGYSFDPARIDGFNKLMPDSRNPRSYEAAITQLKSFLIKRGDWMDAYIENLRQYSHPSKIKPY